MTYSYNPEGAWTGAHQMSINGKRDAFKHEDFKICAKTISIKCNRAEVILKEVQQAVLRQEIFAAKTGVSNDIIDKIKRTNRLNIFRKQETGIALILFNTLFPETSNYFILRLSTQAHL